jgi:LEA14-like dessication related protein
MKFHFTILSLLLVLTSCASFETPEFKGGESFKIDKIEGKTVRFSAGGKVSNENWFGIKVKPSEFNVYLDNDFLGTVRLEKKVKLKRKSEAEITAPFKAELVEGAMLKFMRLTSGNETKIRLQGKAKAGVFIFSKKFAVDETIPFSGKSLKLN